MKTQVLNFFYKGSKDSKFLPRQIFLMNMTKDYIQGFDFSELILGERNFIKKTFKNREIYERFASAKNPAKVECDSEKIQNLIKKSWKTFKRNKECCKKISYNKNTQMFVTWGKFKCTTKKDLQKAFAKLGTKEAVRKGVERSLKSFTENFGVGVCQKTYRGFQIWGFTDNGKTVYKIQS